MPAPAHTQLTLPGCDDIPTARATDPETSHEAAAGVRHRAEDDRRLVLRILRTHGPLTDFEVAAITGRLQTSLGVRRGELCKAGLVAFAGYTRPSPSGSSARVWIAL